MTAEHDEMRSMVRQAIREALPAIVREVAAEQVALQRSSTAPVSAPGQSREPVVIRTDADLDAFVHRLLALVDNPVTRQHLRSGRRSFTLVGADARTASSGVRTSTIVVSGEVRVERGAVTERQVLAAADQGLSLTLGPRAVLTPLARDRARALGVDIRKES